MDARLFRRVQRYGWDAATDAYDRDWVPIDGHRHRAGYAVPSEIVFATARKA
jgi:hypothetical protein